MSTAHRDWRVWSTEARLVVTDEDALDEATAIAHALLGRVELACSRFRDDSELARLAPRLAGRARVSPLLAHLVGIALDVARATAGAVVPTLGRELAGLGYDRDIRLVLDDDSRPIRVLARRREAWREIDLQDDVLRVPADIALDLGATAKPAAADLIAAAIAERLGCGALISLGGDISIAGPEPARGWHIRVQDRPGDPATTVRLDTEHGLATSSTQRRRWRRAGETVHHILDPATGAPAPAVWRSVSVAARSAAAANAFSTAGIVWGQDAVQRFRTLGTHARLVAADGTVVTTGDWPADGAAHDDAARETTADGMTVAAPDPRRAVS